MLDVAGDAYRLGAGGGDRQSRRGQRRLYVGQRRGAGTELRTELRLRQPLVELRGAGGLLRLEKRLERRLVAKR